MSLGQLGLGELASQQRREPVARRDQTSTPLGKIIAVSGSTATIGILPTGLSNAEDARTTVSKFITIHDGKSRLIGVITEISLNLPPFAKEQGYLAIAEVDLMGEIRNAASAPEFWRGVSEYPAMRDTRAKTRAQLRGMRHCIVQCTPVFKNAISVLPSKGRSADFNSLVPKPASPIAPIGGPSVSSQVMLSRSSDADHDTCSSPWVAENAPYFPALVASS